MNQLAQHTSPHGALLLLKRDSRSPQSPSLETALRLPSNLVENACVLSGGALHVIKLLLPDMIA